MKQSKKIYSANETAWRKAWEEERWDIYNVGYIYLWLHVSYGNYVNYDSEGQICDPEEHKKPLSIKIKSIVLDKQKYPIWSISSCPKGSVVAKGSPDSTTKLELLAEVILRLVQRSKKYSPAACIWWDETDYTFFNQRPQRNTSLDPIPNIPYISVYNHSLYFPDTTTKEELIENAKQIAETWCPRAHVVWSETETIWPKLLQEEISYLKVGWP